MDYENKYKEALAAAKHYYEELDSDTTKNVLEEIFSELAESEDERIRKEITATIHLYYGEPLEDEAKEMIAWLEKQGKLVAYYEDKLDRCACENFNKGYKKALEKQGEHANFLSKIQIGDKVTRNEDGVLVNLSQLKRVAKPAEKQGEPIRDTDTVDSNEDGLVAETIKYKHETQDEQKQWDSVKPVSEEDKLCLMPDEQKPAWSEEDESYLNTTIAYLKDAKEFKKTAENCINWIKSLKDRVQPKREWSEDDEKCLENAIMYCEWARDKAPDLHCYETSEKSIGLLKSIKQRIGWKPSDEQIYWIGWVAHRLPDTEKANEAEAVLEELLEQLKKLK